MLLFDIIKSMSAAEKRHFKLYAGITGRGRFLKYVELFDMLNKQIELKESAIAEAGFAAVDKNFLQEKIEASLHVQYLGKNVDSKIKWLLEGMSRQANRGHWEELRKSVKKVKQLAEKNERFSDWLEAIKWEKEWLDKCKEKKNLYERYQQIVLEETKVRKYLEEEINYKNLRMSIEYLRRKDVRLVDVSNHKKFKEYNNSKWLKTAVPPYSIEARANFYHAKCLIAQYTGQLEKSYQYIQNLIILFEQNTHFQNRHIIWYRNSLGLISEICYLAGKNQEIPHIIDKIEQLPIRTDAISHSVYFHGLLYAITNVDKRRGTQYISLIEKFLRKNKSTTRDGRQLAFFYNISIFYMLFEEWDKGALWIDRVFNYKRTDDRRDLQYAARILSLMSKYELESDNMDNHIQAITKYLKTNQQYTETNQHILQAFRELYKAINKKEQLPIWEKLNNYLTQKLQEQTLTTRQLGLEELQLWCKAKLQNTTMAAIIKATESQKKASATV